MSPLRRRMIEDMQIRNLTLNTQRVYVEQVGRFARHFRKSPEHLGPTEIRTYLLLCLPIMPSERTDDEDRRAMRSMRYARLSAQVDEGEYPCPVQDACALRYSRRYILPTDGAGDFRRTPRHGRGTRVGSIRSAVQHDRSATVSVARRPVANAHGS